MRKFFTLMTLGLVLFSCKDEDKKPVSKKNTAPTAAVKDTTQTVQADSSDLLELFSKNEEEVASKLKTITNEEANELYEKYFLENNILLHQIEQRESNALNNFYSEKAADKKNIKLLNEKLLKHKLEFEEIGEGYVEITTKNDFYYALFRDYVTSDYKRFLYLKSEENKFLYSADAGLAISFEDLGDRIISWENFINQYPTSKLTEQVTEEYKSYQLDYLRGLDNTPTVENAHTEKYIYPENIQEFNRFLKKYPTSPTVVLINTFMKNFKNEDIYNILKKEQDNL